MSVSVPENFNLGYACICTELRKKNVFCSRTLRLATLKVKGVEYAKELAIKNVKDLLTILEYNVKHEIYLMRISSDIFPFATHPEYGYSIDFAEEYLKKAGDYAKLNKIRITMHPGQFNVLSSHRPEVVKNTTIELNHNCKILDLMGLDQNRVMVVHGGSTYGNKKEALKRLVNNINLLPHSTKNRLVLENCECSYTVEELLPISEETQVPLVIDFHHDDIKPSTEPIDFYFDRVFKVWNNRNIKPKVHVSNSVPGVLPTDTITKRRKHSDLIYFLHEPLLKIKFPIDVMLEAKLKEQAVFNLRIKK